MGAYARRLPRASYREHQKNHLRCARFRCGLTPYNARWPASPASTRPHAWLGAVPLEAGRQWTLVHPDCLFLFPVKGSDLVILGDYRGGAPGGQCDHPLVLLC
jgi:hypothetical protein